MSVECSIRDAVAMITLNRPGKLNAMTDHMWGSLERTLGELQQDDNVRVIALQGAGGNFCAGSDVSTLIADSPLAERMRVSNRCVLAVYESRVPTVAVVDGVAAGAGVNLALACDLVIASDRSRFIEVFIRRGLTLDSGGSWLLPRLIGEHRAHELAFLGDAVDAARAQQWGLANQVVAADDLESQTTQLCARLAAANPKALAASKRLIRASRTRSLAEALEAEIAEQLAVIDSEAARAHIAAFGNDQPAVESTNHEESG